MAVEPQQSERTRRLLADAFRALEESRKNLLQQPANPAEGAAASFRSIRAALLSLLTWHGVPSSEEAPFATISAQAQQLSSNLRTPLQRARGIEALARNLQGKDDPPLNDREAALMSHYTARNLLDVVVAELPPAVVPAEAATV